MAKTNPDVISLKGEPIFKEGQASSPINPGYFVEFGGSKDIQAQSTYNADCRRAIALENDLLGKGINDTYIAGDRVRYGSFHAGQEVNVKLAALAIAVAKGDAMEVDGSGTVRKQNAGAIVGYALNAVDNSSGTSETFITMEVA